MTCDVSASPQRLKRHGGSSGSTGSSSSTGEERRLKNEDQAIPSSSRQNREVSLRTKHKKDPRPSRLLLTGNTSGQAARGSLRHLERTRQCDSKLFPDSPKSNEDVEEVQEVEGSPDISKTSKLMTPLASAKEDSELQSTQLFRSIPSRPSSSPGMGTGRKMQAPKRSGRRLKPSKQGTLVNRLENVQLLECIGQGTFGDVFLATESISHRRPLVSFSAPPSPGSDHASCVISDAQSLASPLSTSTTNCSSPASTESTTSGFSRVALTGELCKSDTTIAQGEERFDEVLALKIVHKNKVVESDMVDQAVMEISVLKKIQRHPFVASLQFAYQTPTKLYLGLEFCPGGELFALIRDDKITANDAKLFTAEIALALHFLHSNSIIHRDLKPENIVLSATGHVRLVDFGLSVVLDPGKHLNQTSNRLEIVTQCGTLAYTAPEILRRDSHSFESDWWSLGVICYELLSGWPPFGNETDDQYSCQMICTADFDPSEGVPPASPQFALIQRLLNKNTRQRLGYELDQFESEFKTHAFFADLNWAQVEAEQTTLEYSRPVTNPRYTGNFDPEFTCLEIGDRVAIEHSKPSPDFAGYDYIPEIVVPRCGDEPKCVKTKPS